MKRITIVGNGWFGSRLLKEFSRRSDVKAVVVDRSVKNNFPACDLLFDATGDVDAGLACALWAVDHRVPLASVNAEFDCTFGYGIAFLFRSEGLIYTIADGDQPGCLARMLRQIESWGFTPRVYGNQKKFLDKYATPNSIVKYAVNGLKPDRICAFTDGTKQAMELACIANGTGASVLTPGMYGPKISPHELVSVRGFGTTPKGRYVDYFLDCSDTSMGGVFVIAECTDPQKIQDMRYLKMGDGPLYLFYREYHLCAMEAVSVIDDVFTNSTPLLTATGRNVTVAAIAKRDLPPGHDIDGIGGFDAYGECRTTTSVMKDGIFSISLSSHLKTIRQIMRDEPLTMENCCPDGSLLFGLS